MTDKVEGTLVISGMAEGKIPNRPEVQQRLHEWVKFANSLNLRFHLEVDGNSFSLLGDNTPVEIDDIGPDPTTKIADALREFLKVFTQDERRGVFSTIRSSEFRKDTEVQTLYNIGPDGDVLVRERTAEAQTTEPPRKLTRREKLRYGAIGLGVALAIFGISALFVDYGALFHKAVDKITPFNVGEFKVELGTFRSYFTVEKKSKAGNGKVVLVTIRRTDRFPQSDSSVERLMSEAKESLPARLTVEALARGYVRCELFADKDEFLGYSMQRISGLREKASVTLAIPLPPKRPIRMNITY